MAEWLPLTLGKLKCIDNFVSGVVGSALEKNLRPALELVDEIKLDEDSEAIVHGKQR